MGIRSKARAEGHSDRSGGRGYRDERSRRTSLRQHTSPPNTHNQYKLKILHRAHVPTGITSTTLYIGKECYKRITRLKDCVLTHLLLHVRGCLG